MTFSHKKKTMMSNSKLRQSNEMFDLPVFNDDFK